MFYHTAGLSEKVGLAAVAYWITTIYHPNKEKLLGLGFVRFVSKET